MMDSIVQGKKRDVTEAIQWFDYCYSVLTLDENYIISSSTGLVMRCKPAGMTKTDNDRGTLVIVGLRGPPFE
jgi:hypothetical protein